MKNNDVSLKERKMIKRYASLSTIVYLILFPVLLYISLFSFMAFDNPHMTVFLGLTYISLILFIPLSIPLSIFLIWWKYSRAQYRKALVFCALPLLTATISIFIIELLDVLNR